MNKMNVEQQLNQFNCHKSPFRLQFTTILFTAFLLSSCVGDMRSQNVTTPEFINPLDDQELSTGGILTNPESEIITSDLPNTRFISALSNDTARKIAIRYGEDPEVLAELNGIFVDANLEEGRLIQLPDNLVGVNSEVTSKVVDLPQTDFTDEQATSQNETQVSVNETITDSDRRIDDPFQSPPLSLQNIDTSATPQNQTTFGSEEIKLPQSPTYSQYQTNDDEIKARFQYPVIGQIIADYTGPNGNEGIDIAAPSGTVVVAAGDGVVALLSQSTDETAVVLIRHSDQFYTVYSNLTQIQVEKGQQVKQGQSLGVIADGEKQYLHFELRIGLESTDPIPYLS